MLGLKLNHVCKRDPNIRVQIGYYTLWVQKFICVDVIIYAINSFCVISQHFRSIVDHTDICLAYMVRC